MWHVLYQPVKKFSKFLQDIWFITFPPRVEKEQITMQNILDQFQQPVKQPDQKELQTKYLIHEQMTIFELEQLKMMPCEKYVGLSKIRMEEEGENVYKIRFVPCIVRPETLFRGYHKN